MYFVAEFTTRSAPRESAFWLIGVENVPSMQTKAPFLWQSSETSLISTHLWNGLVGVSVKKSETYICLLYELIFCISYKETKGKLYKKTNYFNTGRPV